MAYDKKGNVICGEDKENRKTHRIRFDTKPSDQPNAMNFMNILSVLGGKN